MPRLCGWRCLLLVMVVSGEWVEMGSMPKALSDMSATVVGTSTVIVVGGCDEAQLSCDWYPGCTYCPSLSTRTYAYDAGDDRWRTLMDHPRERYRHAAAYANDKLYVGGGRDLADLVLAEVDVYDVLLNTWTTLAQASVPRSDLAAFSFEGSVYFWGGYDQNYTTLDSGIAIGGGKLMLPSLKERRGDFGIVVSNERNVAHAVGGWSDADWCNPLSSVEWMDLNEETWTWRSTAKLAVARGDKAAAEINGVVHVVGGEHNNNCTTPSEPVSDVEALRGDVRSAAFWEPVDEIPEPRFRTAAAAIDETHVFLFGGQAPRQTVNCPAEVDYCFPVTDHVWRLSLEVPDMPSSSSSSSKKSKSKKPSRVGFFFIGTAAGILLAALGAFIVLCRGGSPDSDRTHLFKPTTAHNNEVDVPGKKDDAKNTKKVELSAV